MSDEDPWKGWYQEKPPSGEPGYDETRDVAASYRMPPPGDSGSGGPQGAWPQQPPPSSSGSRYGQAG
jgi:hypothetical protein